MWLRRYINHLNAFFKGCIYWRESLHIIRYCDSAKYNYPLYQSTARISNSKKLNSNYFSHSSNVSLLAIENRNQHISIHAWCPICLNIPMLWILFYLKQSTLNWIPHVNAKIWGKIWINQIKWTNHQPPMYCFFFSCNFTKYLSISKCSIVVFHFSCQSLNPLKVTMVIIWCIHKPKLPRHWRFGGFQDNASK